MNIILLQDKDFTRDKTQIVLKDRRFVHIKKILRSQAGDTLEVGLIDGKMGSAQIEKITATQVVLNNIKLSKNPPKPSLCTLILALPRPIVLKRLLGHLTTLGIKEIYLIRTNRVEKSYWQSPVLKEDKMREALMTGLEQAKDTVLPKVHLKKRFRPFIEDELPKIAKRRGRFVAHPDGRHKPAKQSKPYVLVIGPEGGFIPFEIDLLQTHKFSAIDGGVRILKVETAATYFVAKLGS